MSKPKELHLLACFCHGALSALHLLGLIYNLKRKNKIDVIVHAWALGYSMKSTRWHHRVCTGKDVCKEDL